MQPPDNRQGRWVSFDQARMILGMSEGTLRRAIRDGKVTAEQRRRSPDSPTDLRMVYEVLVTDPPSADAPSESEHPPETRQEAPALSERLLETALAQAEQLADLRERVGRAEAEAEHERARADEAARRFEAEREKRVAEAGELGSARAGAFIAGVERDQAIRERDALQASLDQARAELAQRRWWKWW